MATAKCLEGLEPKRVFEVFSELSEIPHGSKNEKAIISTHSVKNWGWKPIRIKPIILLLRNQLLLDMKMLLL